MYGILAGMDFNALEWIAAVGGVAATAGAWRTEATARWQARVERLRNDRMRRENELHRQRFAEVWTWQRDQPAGEERAKAARWFGEWTGARPPHRSLDDGPQTPGLHSADADDAYERYAEFLDAIYEPGRLGPAPCASTREIEIAPTKQVDMNARTLPALQEPDERSLMFGPWS